jgi:hypothetical protein
MQVPFELLEGGLSGPAFALHPGNVFGRGRRFGQVGQQRQFPVTIARGLFQDDSDAAQSPRRPTTIADSDILLIARAGLAPPDKTLFTLRLPGQSLVLAADKVGLPVRHPVQEIAKGATRLPRN